MQSKASLSLSLSSTSTSSSSPSIQWEGTRDFHGLLTGFNRQSNITAFPQMYYTDKLNFTACKEEFYKENDILWRSYMQDIRRDECCDQEIESISKATKEFVNSKEVYDRGEVIENLKLIEKGDIVILTGGPSTGKSLVVNHLFGKQSNYLYLDGRLTGPNIIDAVIDNLMERDKLRFLTVKSFKNVTVCGKPILSR